MRDFFDKHRKWLLILAALLVAALFVALFTTTAPAAPITEAEPPTEREVTFDLEKNRAYSAEDGIVIIPAEQLTGDSGQLTVNDDYAVSPLPIQFASVVTDGPEEAWTMGIPVGSGDYTMPEQVLMDDGSIGMLTVPKLSLAVSVYETEDEMEAMTHGLAHFKTTSAWDGNVALCGHNINFDLTDGHFKHLYTLVPGDIVSYATALGNRAYAVETVAEIAETDWSYLGRTGDNRLTLITCISGRPTARLVVQAVEI